MYPALLLHPVRRLFVLLGAYEDLTERETGALRRGDLDHAIAIENRKQRLAAAIATARQNSELSAGEIDALNQRVRGLEQREHDNLSFLREEMARVRAALTTLHQASQRSRQVRRGYAGAAGSPSLPAEGMLGRA